MAVTQAGGRPRRKRRPHRREQILGVAADLFSEKGYHATGMDDIGAAAGITGPGIYRHFHSKEEILEEIVLARAAESLSQAHIIIEDSADAEAALTELVISYVHALINYPAVAAVAVFERRSLTGRVRATITRAERQYFEEWVTCLVEARPGLDEATARVMIQGAFGLGVTAALYPSGIPGDELATIVEGMMLNAFGFPGP